MHEVEAKSVIENAIVEQKVKAFKEKFSLFDDIYEIGVKYNLARLHKKNPAVELKQVADDIYGFSFYHNATNLSIDVVFHIGDNEIEIKDINAYHEEQEEVE